MTTTVNNKEAIGLLFSRPGEPIFMPKGQGKRVMFEVPDSFLKNRHKAMKKILNAKWKTEDTVYVPVKNVNVPDISAVMKVRRDDSFLTFSEKHQKCAAALIKIFMDQKTTDDLISVAAFCHERVNPYLFNYSLSVALLHRKDTKEIKIPNYFQCFPAKFIPSPALIKARQEASVIPKEVREPIVIPQMFTANAREPEQKVAYFREDIGINLHHMHWHLVYPTLADDISIVAKDRRGELFYYMHEQVLARYNAERWANDMPRVKALENIANVIPEAYFSKLVTGISSRTWPVRIPNISVKDIDRPEDELTVKIADLQTFERNILEAVKNRMAKGADGKNISLAGDDGIDILGNMVEASMLTVNRPLYGSYHNLGHVLIAYAHDPDGRYLEDASVMADTATAMRDPVFYRWHVRMNDIFVSLLDKATPYTKSQLTFNNVAVTAFKVSTTGKPVNEFHTNWQQSAVDFSVGLDFSPLGPISIRFTHLQHEAFQFTINVNNTSGKQLIGYARIFMAPKYKEGGVVMNYNEQRTFMIELDKFKVILKKGINEIKRKSDDSSVTIPFDRTFRNIGDAPTDPNLLKVFNFCGCGWPHHMLIPKGTVAGMEYNMFVMISDYSQDTITQDISGVCSDAESYCGIQDKKYPDKKNLGYPFERRGAAGVNTLNDFLTPNMKVQNVVVKFTDKVVNTVPEPSKISVVPVAQPT